MNVKADYSVWNKLKKEMFKANSYDLELGWFEDQVYGPSNDNLKMAQIAQWNNEGHRNDNGTWTPSRPFMSVGLTGAFAAGANKEDFKNMIQSVLKGQGVLTAMKQSEASFERTLRKVMLDWDTPRNAPLTIELKGFDDPLIETSELVANVTARTKKSGS